MYERIILPFDGVQRALAPLPYAEELAHTWQAPLEILHIATENDLPAEAQPAGHDVTVIQADDPAQAICDHMRASDPPGLLCMASRGRTGLARMLTGSLTTDVIRNAPIPILTLRPEHLK